MRSIPCRLSVRLLSVLLLASSAAAVASPAAGRLPADEDVRARMRAFVEEAKGAPGLVVALRDADGRRRYAHGVSGPAAAPAMETPMRFEVGSISKGFTGMLLADMIGRGEVRADQTLGELMPGGGALAPEVAAITLEDLATHHSGLPRLPLDAGLVVRAIAGDPYRGTTAQDLFDAVAGLSPARIGERRGGLAYSNLGSALLGQLLALHARRPYEALLEERVLAPLGIADAGFLTGAPPEDTVQGHRRGRPVPPWHADAYTPAGGLLLDAEALLDLGERMLAGTPGFVAESMRPRRTFGREGRSRVGLGWFHDGIGGRHAVWHNGATGGMRGFFAVVPEQGWVVVVLANGGGDVDGFAAGLIHPGRPPPSRPARWLAMSPTLLTLLVLLGAPPYLLWQARAAGVARLDRVRALDKLGAAGIALLLVWWMGDWTRLPFASWWLSLAAAAAAAAVLLRRAWVRPWLAPGRWRHWRVLSQAVSLASVALLLWIVLR